MLKDFKNSVKKKKEISVAEHVFTSWNLAYIAPGTSTNSITRQLFFFFLLLFFRVGKPSTLFCFYRANISSYIAAVVHFLISSAYPAVQGLF